MDCSPNSSIETDAFPLDHLIEAFCLFKGIGHKTAQRLALDVITLPKEKIASFAQALTHTNQHIRFCVDCFYLTWAQKCHVCLDHRRHRDTLCIVAEPKDVLAIEQSRQYNGLYHVLGGGYFTIGWTVS